MTDARAALEPCPFCGSRDIRFTCHPREGRGMHAGEDVWSMCCYDCGATHPNRYRRELLVEAWPRRASLPAAPAGWREARKEIMRLMREDFDPTPPGWEGRDWDDNAEDVADRIVAAAASAAPQHASEAWLILKRWLAAYAEEEATFSRYADNVMLDGVMTAAEMRKLNAALSAAPSAPAPSGGVETLIQRVRGILSDFAEREPEPDETWESWYRAAFDLAVAKVVALAATPPAQEASGVETQAARDVLAERERQKTVEGWTPEHDDEHTSGQLADAAACYAATWMPQEKRNYGWYDFGPAGDYHVPICWPKWSGVWWKPTNRRRDLVKAGALILAEIERLDRTTPPASAEKTATGGGECPTCGGSGAFIIGPPEDELRKACEDCDGTGRTSGR